MSRGRTIVSIASFLPLFPALCGQALAGPLDGKTYIIQMDSAAVDSGYANYLVPPLSKAFDDAGLKAKGGPGADVVANLIVKTDVGQWMETAKGRQWMYTVTITAGISPEDYEIPYEGTPQFGAEVSLVTPNGDRQDELACLITLAAKTAIAHYQPKGFYKTSGQTCLRKE